MIFKNLYPIKIPTNATGNKMIYADMELGYWRLILFMMLVPENNQQGGVSSDYGQKALQFTSSQYEMQVYV